MCFESVTVGSSEWQRESGSAMANHVICEELDQLVRVCNLSVVVRDEVDTRLAANQHVRSKCSSLASFLGLVELIVKYLLVFALVLVFLLCFVSLLMNTWIQKAILSHSQELIYPIMRQVRLLALSMVGQHEQLKSFYIEECLFTNPFFIGHQTDCMACRYVHSVTNLNSSLEIALYYALDNKPFIMKNLDSYRSINLNSIQWHIHLNQEDLKFGTVSMLINIPLEVDLSAANLFQVMNSMTNEERVNLHVEWRMNRVESARVWRRLFARPECVPRKTEVSLEKYLLLDGSNATGYQLPLTQFANVWLIQLQGPRIFIFQPTSQCLHQCRTFSVMLDHGDLLYYNRLLWSVTSQTTIRYTPQRVGLQTTFTFTYLSSFY